MMGVCWGERKALEPLGWLGLQMAWIFTTQFVVFYDHFTYSLKFFSTGYYKGSSGRECGLIPREFTALTGKIAVCTCPSNIVDRLQCCFFSLGAQNAVLVGRLYETLGRTMDQKTSYFSEVA